jgi:MFS family permease
LAVNLLPLFLVSFAAVGYETALTRYFAVAKWSEYGYWVISIVMVGFAFSGVVLALWRDALARRAGMLFAALPAGMVLTAALGYHFTVVNPFNPLQLQNPATWADQLWNIAGYYAALLPFFFLAGLFISLTFVCNPTRIGPVYAADLAGAGAGAAGILVLMYFVPAFHLLPYLLIPLALAGLLAGRSQFRLASGGATVLALVAAEALLLLGSQASYNEFKAIYAPLHTPNAKVLGQIITPRGEYQLLDDFTERVDTDISNNAGMLGIEGPPRSFGLYRDGNRIASVPRPGPIDSHYAEAALDALPYKMIPGARVLLIGASGGFRPAEVKQLSASQVRVLEPEPTLHSAGRPWSRICTCWPLAGWCRSRFRSATFPSTHCACCRP